MAIMKYPLRTPTYSAWRDIDEPFNRLARLFDFDGATSQRDGFWSPAVNITETKEEMLLTAELPGMSEDDIHVELENNVLSISGEKAVERTESEGEDGAKYHVWERTHGSFRRSFTLPRTVSGDEITAAFDNGVLTVRLPKAPEAKGRRIAISHD